jgi:peptidoglycan hydrolase-like protein with peptidoglycan-binding domain
MTRRAASWSIRRTHALLERLGAEAAPFFRFPKGRRDERAVGIVGRQGYRSVRWTINPGDGSAGAIAEQVRGELRPGAILSLDLWRRSHVRALPKILKALRGKLLKPRPIDALSDSRAIRWDREITPGWKGEIVTYIQDRLNAATYPAGAADGKFSTNTLHAVYAFEKVHGLELDGRLSPEEMELLALAEPPPPPRDQSGRYIDIDIARQVLFEVEDGKVVNTYPISSASGATYVSDGETRIASTPRGDFAIDRKIPGWRVSDLGELYYPSYFYGGYAIHGSYSVPTYPASHGCIRIPMHVAADFYARNATGTPVYVHD